MSLLRRSLKSQQKKKNEDADSISTKKDSKCPAGNIKSLQTRNFSRFLYHIEKECLCGKLLTDSFIISQSFYTFVLFSFKVDEPPTVQKEPETTCSLSAVDITSISKELSLIHI